VRPISEQRRLVEQEGRKHSVLRGRWKQFHFENMPKLQRAFGCFLQVLHLKGLGQRNTLEVQLKDLEFEFSDLPPAFDDYRILFISDMHIDGMDALTNRITELIDSSDYDLCILGGDYTFSYGWKEGLDHSNLKRIVQKLIAKTRVVGILGNHDVYAVAELLDGMGVEILINDNTLIEKGQDNIHIAGIDDSHYFGSDDLSQATSGIEGESFKILAAHSPESLNKASHLGYNLYLTGHTHGGQVCLPGGTQIVRGASMPRKFLKGCWQCGKMSGYTTTGAGTSGLDVRFFCKPEIAMITLKRAR